MKKTVLFLSFFTIFFSTQSQNLILNPSTKLPTLNDEIPYGIKTISSSRVSVKDVIFFNFYTNTAPD